MDSMLPFCFDLPSSSLIYVSCERQLDNFGSALKGAILLGIDTETKPTFVPRHLLRGDPNPTSIVQIAVRSDTFRECVFIVDLLKLVQTPALMSKLDSYLQVAFLNRKCIKIGQGLTNDLKELVQAYPYMNSFRLAHSVLETHDLTKYLQPVLINPLSLKNLVKQYLHSDLRKDQQMSDWSRRPLSEAQIHYAACDALVLLRLHDAMSCEIECKLSSSDEECGSESGTTTSSDHSVVAQSTILSLTHTVDFTALVVRKSGKKNRRKANKEGQHRNSNAPVLGLDLNSALLRGSLTDASKDNNHSRSVHVVPNNHIHYTDTSSSCSKQVESTAAGSKRPLDHSVTEPSAVHKAVRGASPRCATTRPLGVHVVSTASLSSIHNDTVVVSASKVEEWGCFGKSVGDRYFSEGFEAVALKNASYHK